MWRHQVCCPGQCPCPSWCHDWHPICKSGWFLVSVLAGVWSSQHIIGRPLLPVGERERCRDQPAADRLHRRMRRCHHSQPDGEIDQGPPVGILVGQTSQFRARATSAQRGQHDPKAELESVVVCWGVDTCLHRGAPHKVSARHSTPHRHPRVAQEAPGEIPHGGDGLRAPSDARRGGARLHFGPPPPPCYDQEICLDYRPTAELEKMMADRTL